MYQVCTAVPPNKAFEQTNGALASLSAPFAAQRQRSADTQGEPER